MIKNKGEILSKLKELVSLVEVKIVRSDNGEGGWGEHRLREFVEYCKSRDIKKRNYRPLHPAAKWGC